MLKSSYEVEVLINGKPVKEYGYKGKVFIEGRKGTPFTIRIRNNSYARKLFIPTIDGLSVLDGSEGSYNSRGYIVPGHSSITIDGWRVSDQEVATFYFSSPEGSYRKRMDKGNNLGVIGVAVVGELIKYTGTLLGNGTATWPYSITTTPAYPSPQSPFTIPPGIYCGNGKVNASWQTGGLVSSVSLNGITSTHNLNQALASVTNTNCSASALGTGWGEQKKSEVISVEFERESSPETVFEIHYNTREQLEKAGISLKKEPVYVSPQAFPGQYCKPPTDCKESVNRD